MKQDEYVGKYLDKKMKNHDLPHGMAYYNLLSKFQEKAEKNFENYIKRKIKSLNHSK
jgi:hypothetical protein